MIAAVIVFAVALVVSLVAMLVADRTAARRRAAEELEREALAAPAAPVASAGGRQLAQDLEELFAAYRTARALAGEPVEALTLEDFAGRLELRARELGARRFQVRLVAGEVSIAPVFSDQERRSHAVG